MTMKRVLSILVLALAAAPTAFAQAQAPAPSAPDFVIPKPEGPAGSGQSQPNASSGQPANPASYHIGPQDELRITVFGEDDLSQLYRVDSDGFITMPLIARVAAAGLTPIELQERIRMALANGFLRNPQVSVQVNQFKSQSVIVSGEVRNPGRVQMTEGHMTLLEALAQAGSPTSSAADEVIVVHQPRPNPTAGPNAMTERQTVTVSLKDLQLGKAGQDVVLEDGDLINVPVAQRFFIQGFVRNPGTYVISSGMTVRQAIALAGGLNERGSDRRIKVTRLVKGKVEEQSIELDDKVQPNDTVTIQGRFF